MKSVVFGIISTLLLIGTFTLAFDIQPVRADSSVYVFEIVWEEIVFHVAVESNSTVSHFNFNQPMKEVGFNVWNVTTPQLIGFCNVTIPKSLLWAEHEWTVLVDAQLPVIYTQTENTTHSMLYFTYVHSTHAIRIIGTHVIGPTTIIVPDDYPTIQEAINNANEGDTIYVRNGTYCEHVVVNKTISLIGEDRRTTVIDGNGTGTVVTVTANNVIISGSRIQRAGMYECGIEINEHVINTSLYENIITNNWYGIVCQTYSSYNSIYQNIIRNNNDGVHAYGTDHLIRENIIANNTKLAIHTLKAPQRSDRIKIIKNNITNNWRGINICGHWNIVSENIIANNTETGTSLRGLTENNIITSNVIMNNMYGIVTDFWDNNNTISRNTIQDNAYGLYLNWSSSNTIYHNNFIDNLVQAHNYPGDKINIWDHDYPSGGNYWSDHVCNGNPSDGSQPYVIDENNIDHYPFQDPNGWLIPKHDPKAEFTATPETTTMGESVTFDASASTSGWNGTHTMSITEYRWNFGGSINITTPTPILYYSFISPGIYYVTLTVYAPGATPETDSITHKVTVTAVPVGGYSLPIEGYRTEKPLTLYLALVAILTVSFTIAKRRKKQQN